MKNPQLNKHGELVHLLSIEGLPRSILTQVLEAAVEEHQPPIVDGRRIKLRYAHAGGHNPPIIVIHGNSLEHVTESYKRFLEGRFRKEFDLVGTPLRIEMKTSQNPYANKEGD